jgi:CBS domain-containing protein
MRARSHVRTIGLPSEGGPVKIENVMTKAVATVGTGTSLKEVASILAEHRISGLPVVDDAGRVLGVVSEGDIIRKEAIAPSPRGGLLAWLDGERDEIRAKLAARTAGEAMTAPALTIEADRSVAEAASLMVEEGVNRLPVVDGGMLVGIVTRADLVRAFLRSDDEIEREILEDVGLGTFAIAPENLHVVVANGEVTLGGEVETPDVAELLAAFVERVPGVVSVRSHVTSRANGRVTPRL